MTRQDVGDVADLVVAAGRLCEPCLFQQLADLFAHESLCELFLRGYNLYVICLMFCNVVSNVSIS